MSSSTVVVQSHLNDVSRSGSSNANLTAEQANFPGSHHLHSSSHISSIQSQSNTNSSSSVPPSVCNTCTHHFHHIHHHHSSSAITAAGGSCISGNNHLQQQQQQQHHHPHYHHQLHEDNERQISGETHVAVTVHSQQSHQYQALDNNTNSGNGEDSCDCNQSGQEQSGRSSRIASGDEATPSSSEDNNIRKCTHRGNK